ncbi:DUF424 domain-containing protein [Nitrosopumilus sp.]|uniref:DUF424 domain-containing protein n=1 Tax=Nitrosopumilus sp. TaxID=2024843 RepID=UPI003B5A99B7
MQFSIRVTNYQQNQMLNICDSDLIGKTVIGNDLTMDITNNYYGEKIVTKDEAKTLLQNSSIINMVGKETISLSLELGIGSKDGVKIISDIPFLIVFKM